MNLNNRIVTLLGTDHLTCRGGGGYGFFFVQKYFFSDNTRVRICIFFVAQSTEFFFPEFNIRLYDKNSESDYFFFLYQNQNIFSATLGIRMFFFLEKYHNPPLWKLNGSSLIQSWRQNINLMLLMLNGNPRCLPPYEIISVSGQ